MTFFCPLTFSRSPHSSLSSNKCVCVCVSLSLHYLVNRSDCKADWSRLISGRFKLHISFHCISCHNVHSLTFTVPLKTTSVRFEWRNKAIRNGSKSGRVRQDKRRISWHNHLWIVSRQITRRFLLAHSSGPAVPWRRGGLCAYLLSVTDELCSLVRLDCDSDKLTKPDDHDQRCRSVDRWTRVTSLEHSSNSAKQLLTFKLTCYCSCSSWLENISTFAQFDRHFPFTCLQSLHARPATE
jgi:hypothetical protein